MKVISSNLRRRYLVKELQGFNFGLAGSSYKKSLHSVWSNKHVTFFNAELNCSFNSFMTEAVCSTNQWTGFYMITVSAMTELITWKGAFSSHYK